MNLDDRIAQARHVISTCMANYERPAIWCSFGKDSMVILHIMRQMEIGLPIVFYTDPWFPRKYSFARKVIADWNLEVYDYPPSAVTLWEGKDIMAFTNHYKIGPTRDSTLALPKNIVKPDGNGKWVCGVDLLNRPLGDFNYPFDVAFVGHKSSDEDQIAGKVPLNCDIKQNAHLGTDLAFPLRQWTDADVWEYITANDVPMQQDRYDIGNRSELPNKHNNSDYAHVCIACIDRREKAKSVMCPKIGLEVSNISAIVRYAEPRHDYYGEANVNG